MQHKNPKITPKNKTVPKISTSWGPVAEWYDEMLGKGDTYQEKVIAPNVLRLVTPHLGQPILDLACGTGYFTRLLKKNGTSITGTDISKELLTQAKAHDAKENLAITYHASPAHKMTWASDKAFQTVISVLALQNIEKLPETLREVARVLRPGGTFIFVINHPVLRIPQKSAWGFDEEKKMQYRRIDKYMNEHEIKIVVHPGQKDSPAVPSFHRPLQNYFKALASTGFAVTHLEEWISHKESQAGPRALAENSARKEFPLFLTIVAKKF